MRGSGLFPFQLSWHHTPSFSKYTESMTSNIPPANWLLIPVTSRAMLLSQSQLPAPCLPTDPFGSRTATHTPYGRPDPDAGIICRWSILPSHLLQQTLDSDGSMAVRFTWYYLFHSNRPNKLTIALSESDSRRAADARVANFPLSDARPSAKNPNCMTWER